MAFQTLNPEFVGPVGGFTHGGGIVAPEHIAGLPSDRAHLWVGKIAHQLAHRIRLVKGVGIREHHQVTGGLSQGRVEAQRFSAPGGHGKQAERRTCSPDQIVRAIVGGV